MPQKNMIIDDISSYCLAVGIYSLPQANAMPLFTIKAIHLSKKSIFWPNFCFWSSTFVNDFGFKIKIDQIIRVRPKWVEIVRL